MGAYGIDVSDFQGSVNWQAVAGDGISFAFLKATEGTSFTAATFARNWAGVKAAGLIRGAYHFFRPQNDPQAQAEHFLRTVKFEPGDLPPVLDIESTGELDAGAIVERMAKWLAVVETATKRKPIIYTYANFWKRLGNPLGFSDFPLWIAHYTSAAEPLMPAGWDTWTVWQYTDSGKVKGISGGVDTNRFKHSQSGATGSKVMGIQKCLQDKGFYSGSASGIFDAGTLEAVLAFQKAMGLEVDGIVGVRTWTALADPFLLPAPPAPPDAV